MILKGRGKLMKPSSEEVLTLVDYSIFTEASLDGSERWQGELLSIDSVKIIDGGRYMIELEDSRRGICSLRKKVNKAVMGLPVRYFYQLSGGSFIEKVSDGE